MRRDASEGFRVTVGTGSMLRYSFVLITALWSAGFVSAGAGADSLFTELSKDFGSVPRGPTLTHNFHIVNNTKSDVNISNVRVSCGCTSTVLEKSYLKPGEETNLIARMDTNRFLGTRTVTIFVQFDQPRLEEVRLWVQANSRNDFAVKPDVLAFGTVKRGTAPTASADVVFYGSSTTKIVDVRGESNYMKPTFAEVKREGYEVVYRVSVTMSDKTPVGKWYSDIWVKTDNAAMAQIRVPMTVEIESSLHLSPDVVAVGQLKIGAESERRVILRGVKPFKITEFGGVDSEVSVHDSATEGKAVHVLSVKVKPGKAGDFSRTVKVKTDLDTDGTIELQINAVVMP